MLNVFDLGAERCPIVLNIYGAKVLIGVQLNLEGVRNEHRKFKNSLRILKKESPIFPCEF
jgi:hypothetical protein